MSDAILSPTFVQNEQVFQEQVQLQIGGSKLSNGMQNQTKKHPNVAVYLRCSTDDQTVDSQRSMMSAFMLMHGFDVDEC